MDRVAELTFIRVGSHVTFHQPWRLKTDHCAGLAGYSKRDERGVMAVVSGGRGGGDRRGLEEERVF